MDVLAHSHFFFFAALFTVGLYTIIAKTHVVKKVIGLAVLQTGAFLFFISLAAVKGGTAPILSHSGGAEHVAHVNPLPHVLILTAIVVGVSTMSVALALCIRIRQEFGSCESDSVREEAKE